MRIFFLFLLITFVYCRGRLQLETELNLADTSRIQELLLRAIVLCQDTQDCNNGSSEFLSQESSLCDLFKQTLAQLDEQSNTCSKTFMQNWQNEYEEVQITQENDNQENQDINEQDREQEQYQDEFQQDNDQNDGEELENYDQSYDDDLDQQENQDELQNDNQDDYDRDENEDNTQDDQYDGEDNQNDKQNQKDRDDNQNNIQNEHEQQNEEQNESVTISDAVQDEIDANNIAQSQQFRKKKKKILKEIKSVSYVKK